MTAETALDKQIQCYRLMTGEQKLKIALDMPEMPCNIPLAAALRVIMIRCVRKKHEA